jgi:hypothetical protein
MGADILQTKYDRLLNASIAVRKAMKAYYAYRPKTDMDLARKAELLLESKQREKELDQILKDELQHQQSGQTQLF